jgi:hypothetical protein
MVTRLHGSAPAVLARAERRTHRRLRAGPRVTCNIEDPLAPCSAKVLDVCAIGVGLCVSYPLVPGTTLRLTLTTSAGLLSCTLAAVVRHADERPNGIYLVGCQFERALAYAELRAMLA